MNKKILTTLTAASAVALFGLMTITPAQAQDQTYYTFVSEWGVPRAQWADFEKATEQADSIFRGLVADGTLVAWGSEAELVHAESGYTHADWFVSTSQGGIVKTLEALRSVSQGPALAGAAKHQDAMLHTIAHGGKTAQAASGYIRVSFWQAKPGRGDDLEQFFKKYMQPDLDAGVASGSVLMYNFEDQQIHTDAPEGYYLAIVYANGDGLDKGSAVLAAHAKDNPGAVAGFSSMIDIGTHRDSLGRILAFQHK